MPSSMRSPRASLIKHSDAFLALGSRPVSACAISRTLGPERRTTPIPPRPIGVAIAAMVSRATSSFSMGRLVAVEHALDLPLLEDREYVVHPPVQHQAGREEKEENAEYERHELHHLGLHRVGRDWIHACLQHHRDGHQDRE